MRTAITIFFLLVGVLLFVSGANGLQNGGGGTSGLTSGPIVILATLACVSARTRKGGGSAYFRVAFEVIALLGIGALTFLRRDLKVAIATDPFPSLVIPLLCFGAYVTANLIAPPNGKRRAVPKPIGGGPSVVLIQVGAAAPPSRGIHPNRTGAAFSRSSRTAGEHRRGRALRDCRQGSGERGHQARPMDAPSGSPRGRRAESQTFVHKGSRGGASA